MGSLVDTDAEPRVIVRPGHEAALLWTSPGLHPGVLQPGDAGLMLPISIALVEA